MGEDMYHLRAKPENETRYALKIKCKNLKIKEPSVSVAELKEGQVLYDHVYGTEVVKSNPSEVDFEKTIVVDYYPEKNTKLVFQLFSGISKKSKHIGEFVIPSSNVLSEPDHVVKGEITDGNGKVQANIEVFPIPMKNTYKLVVVNIGLKDISKSKSYVKIYNSSTLFHVSNIAEKSTNPNYVPIILPMEIFNSGDMEKELKVDAFNDDDKLIGTAYFKTCELLDTNFSKTYPLINQEKKHKPGYQNSGYLIVPSFQINEKKTKSQLDQERNN